MVFYGFLYPVLARLAGTMGVSLHESKPASDCGNFLPYQTSGWKSLKLGERLIYEKEEHWDIGTLSYEESEFMAAPSQGLIEDL
jgi:hypothetical protein